MTSYKNSDSDILDRSSDTLVQTEKSIVVYCNASAFKNLYLFISISHLPKPDRYQQLSELLKFIHDKAIR